MTTKTVYDSLFARHKDQDKRTVFSHFFYDGPSQETWETPFERLVQMARHEKWCFEKPEFQRSYLNQKLPILTSYLNYTFLKLQEEQKIKLSDDGDKACFNTGLQTPRGKDIFATFFRNKNAEQKSQPDWTFYAFADSYSEKMSPFSAPLPDIAAYTTNVSDLVFNTDYDIDPNLEHFLGKNAERLPPVLQGNLTMASNAILGAIQALKGFIRRNYKIAIPHYYESKIQLLLPLVLTNDENIAEVALVVERVDSQKLYKGKTLLTMDMAYIDARLITKPADEWLNP